MIRCLSFLLFLLFVSTDIVRSQTGQVPNRHALLIAPGGYAPESGWSPTSGRSDLQQFRRAIARHGFDTLKRVASLQGPEATAMGMRAALTGLLRSVSPGDVVQIYFSGHGARIMDDDGDEADGYDEALAGWDAPAPGRSVSDLALADRYLRDDELWRTIDSLRRKLTAAGHVSLFIDAGFLRSTCMGTALARGGAVSLESEGYRPAAGPAADPEALFTEGGDGNLPETGLAPWLVISAAGSSGCGLEWRDGQQRSVGLLTAALLPCIDRLPGGLTGIGLFRQLQAVMYRMLPGPLPVAEGDGLERPFWGGRYRAAGSDAGVTRIEKDGSLRLDAGWATGWSDSSRVAIYRAGTKPGPAVRPLATGVISQSNPESARIMGVRIPAEIPAAQLRAYLTEPAWLRSLTGLGFVASDRDPGAELASGYMEPGEVRELADRLSDLTWLRFPPAPGVWLRKAKRGFELIHGASGQVLSSMPAEGELADLLPAALRGYAISLMLQRVPILSAAVPPARLQLAEGASGTDRQAFDLHSNVSLQVSNPFEVPMFVNLVELTGGRILSRLPSTESRASAEELVILPGATRIFSDAGQSFSLEGSAGHRIFAWFMSPAPIDLRALAEDRISTPPARISAGLGRLSAVDFSRPSEAVRVSGSEGLSGLIMIRVLPSAPGR